ncbi:PRC-barrel domain-containing protein [Deinococcus peraridilitoris]|uniref:PRC-barrel domain-containing protein n=1 Tax=Deinococcus peraridilitoris TaxID=432329 RepID=UPI0012FC05C4|nr:PRC-barrel domain-containing protein [Deinococcus peraridilitoris]
MRNEVQKGSSQAPPRVVRLDAPRLPKGLLALSACTIEHAAPLLNWLFRRVYDRAGAELGVIGEVYLHAGSWRIQWLEVVGRCAAGACGETFLIPVGWVQEEHGRNVILRVERRELSAQKPQDNAS